MEAIIKKYSGFTRSLMLKCYSESFFDNRSGRIDFRSPLWYCVWRPPAQGLNYWLDRAIELCKTDVTHDLFGMSLTDLLELDTLTFVKLSEVIKGIRDEREKQREEIEKNTAIQGQ